MQDAEFNDGPWEWLDDCCQFVVRKLVLLSCVVGIVLAGAWAAGWL